MEINFKGFKLNIKDILNFVSKEEILSLNNEIQSAAELLKNKSGKGNDFLGWVDLPAKISANDISEILLASKSLRENSEIIVVIGIGGSYLGARAIIDALSHTFKPLLKKKSRFPVVLFAGQNIGEDYLSDLLDLLNKKDYSLIIISKSGTTTEPAIAFRILKNHLEKKYGKKESRKRIIAITDKFRGALKKLADKEKYKSFVIPDDIGGRFSVLTPVGLLPIASAGFNINELLRGAREMYEFLNAENLLYKNPAFLYTAVRNILYRKGKAIEIFVNYTPSMSYFTEWWKQLFGESEGKDGKGIFPAGVSFTTDLHSMGQWMQDGTRNIFETVVWIENSKRLIVVPNDKYNLDELNYLTGKSLNIINKKAMLGTKEAHLDGGVPNILITIPELNEYYLGMMIYFFEYACAVSGYVLGVNPFDQPGVEAYKKNMFRLLGKKA
jgi:glucose-6-phosphate isomerase